MADKQSSPTTTREQAVQIRNAWTSIGATATYGDMTLTELEAAIAALDAVEATIGQLEDSLISARNDYWHKRHLLWELTKRARAGAQAKHGDDSDQYERFGGTRISDRRRPSREPRTS